MNKTKLFHLQTEILGCLSCAMTDIEDAVNLLEEYVPEHNRSLILLKSVRDNLDKMCPDIGTDILKSDDESAEII